MTASYVTGGYLNAETYAVSSATLSSGGAQPGDVMMAFGPYLGSMTSGAGAGWIRQTYVWPGLGYTLVAHWKWLGAADLTGVSHTLSGASYGPLSWVVYRGAADAALVYVSENSGGSGPNHAISMPAQDGRGLGYVHYITDRDGSGLGTVPTGYTQRVGSATGVFTGQIADRLTGNPTGTHMATWTGFSTTYAQPAAVIELRKDDPTAFPAMTTDVAAGGQYIATASNSTYGAAYQAFDQNNATFWGSNPAASWLKIQFPGERKITGYHVRNRPGFTNQTPTSWTFEGSNNDSSWITLDTRSSVSFADGGENSYAVSTPGSYLFYRLNIGGNANNSTIAVVAGLQFDFSTGATGAVLATDSADGLAALGSAPAAGVLAVSDGADALSSLGVANILGSLNATDGADAISASAAMTYVGLIVTEGADISDATGLVRDTLRYGNAFITEGGDTSAATGIVAVRAVAAANDDADIPSVNGLVRGWRGLSHSNEVWVPILPSPEAWTRRPSKPTGWNR